MNDRSQHFKISIAAEVFQDNTTIFDFLDVILAEQIPIEMIEEVIKTAIWNAFDCNSITKER